MPTAGTPFTNTDQVPAYVSNHVPSKVWGEITYPFPNFNAYYLSMLGFKLVLIEGAPVELIVGRQTACDHGGIPKIYTTS